MKKTLGILMALLVLGAFATTAFAAFDANRPISVISREDGSGTRGAFVELFGVEEKDASGQKIDRTTDEAIITNSTAVMLTSVSGNAYAMGYVSLGALNDTVKALSIDGVAPSVDSIKAGQYSIARPFLVAVKGEVSALARDFLNYILSTEGQAVVSEAGYIPIDAVDYASDGTAGKLVVGGSSSVTPVMEKLVEAYAVQNPNAVIEVQQSDSTTGMNGVLDGVLDIGMASRALKDSETDAGLTPIVIAMDGIAVIVSNENPLSDATKAQICKVYTGEATAWSELG